MENTNWGKAWTVMIKRVNESNNFLVMAHLWCLLEKDIDDSMVCFIDSCTGSSGCPGITAAKWLLVVVAKRIQIILYYVIQKFGMSFGIIPTTDRVPTIPNISSKFLSDVHQTDRSVDVSGNEGASTLRLNCQRHVLWQIVFESELL